MALFKIDVEAKNATELEPTSLVKLKLWERRDLQEWVLANPALVGDDVLFISTEFDGFDKTSDRLDILGIKKVEVEDENPFGRLVVIELKRDADHKHALQALQYAAHVSSFTADDVVELLAKYKQIEPEEAEAKLSSFLDLSSDDEIIIDSRPMVLLMSQSYKQATTSTVLWMLEELKLDIACIRLVPYDIEGQLYVQTEKIIPLPEAEQYRIAKQEKEESLISGKRKQGSNILNLLIDNDLIDDGDVLSFVQSRIPAQYREAWPPDRDGLTATLKINGDTPRLTWTDPHTGETGEYAISRLASMVLEMVKGGDPHDASASLQGVNFWELAGRSLRQIALEEGLIVSTAPGKFTTDDVRKICLKIPKGKWTSYSAIAKALGSPRGAQSVSGVLTGFGDADNPHRVLRKNGGIPPNWGSTTGQTEGDCRERLIAEGVEFDGDGRAAMNSFWDPVKSP